MAPKRHTQHLMQIFCLVLQFTVSQSILQRLFSYTSSRVLFCTTVVGGHSSGAPCKDYTEDGWGFTFCLVGIRLSSLNPALLEIHYQSLLLVRSVREAYTPPSAKRPPLLLMGQTCPVSFTPFWASQHLLTLTVDSCREICQRSKGTG